MLQLHLMSLTWTMPEAICSLHFNELKILDSDCYGGVKVECAECRTSLLHALPLKVTRSQEGPATHLCLVLLVCRSYETKPDFAGPPRLMVNSLPFRYRRIKFCGLCMVSEHQEVPEYSAVTTITPYCVHLY
jgi:hypothetical protein